MIKTATIIMLIFVSAICFFSLSVFTYSNTPPAAQTGAPGESNCTSCHGGSAITRSIFLPCPA